MFKWIGVVGVGVTGCIAVIFICAKVAGQNGVGGIGGGKRATQPSSRVPRRRLYCRTREGVAVTIVDMM